ncbi:hypothetical protein ACXZ65_30965 [Streptomyces aculeolatus]
MIRPRELPKVRHQVARHLDDPETSLRTGAGDDIQPGLDALTRHLRAAELYWASPDMTALAVSSGTSLAAARWATADRPAPCGLIVFGGGVGSIDSGGVPIPVEACTWGPHEDRCLIWLLISRRRLKAEMTRTDITLIEEEMAPLIPVFGFTMPVTTEPVSMAEADPRAPTTVVAALAASWLLMQQPQLIDRTREQADRKDRRALARAGHSDPEVTVIDLRRQYVPDDKDPDNTDGEGRRYRHRWVVSGHWRNQAHGPDRSLRRQTWIPAYIKGPEGAPMLATERVNVWRR